MIFERLIALIIFLIILPLILIICFIIFLNDFSNPIYSGKRVGKDFKTFSQFKLRSMSKKKKYLSNVTSSSDNDPRITSIGRFLRKTKFDEIPQLINILLGQMSFVGPRPNVVNEVEKYYNEEKKLLSVKPGITDFSSIVFSDEGEILSESKDPDLDYNLYIRFWKSSLGLIYIKHRSVKLYLYIVFLTIMNFFNREKTLFLISKKINVLSDKYSLISEICLRQKKLKAISFNNHNFLKLMNY